MNLRFNMFSWLEEAAQKHPSSIAVEDLSGNKFTYAELQGRADAWSALLGKAGIAAGQRVAVCADKSPEYIALIFAILKCKAAYVPLDIKNPSHRLQNICKDCQVNALVTDNETTLVVPGYRQLGNIGPFALWTSEKNLTKHEQPLAYILYTSGSTGQPKGVMHTHHSARVFVEWCHDTFKVSGKDKILSHAPFHFDLSIFDIFCTVKSGGTLVVLREKDSANVLTLAQALSEKKISIFYATPSTLSFLCRFGKMSKFNYSNLHTVLFAGEPFPIAHLRELKNFLPHSGLYNLYGPTETNVCTCYKLPEVIPVAQHEPFPIGNACSFALVKINTENELLVAGQSLMEGYWNDEQKTSAAFTIEEGKKWYHTGDLVKTDDAGQIVYVGRKDRMIKRKGYRIEPGEIEQSLLQHGDLSLVAVTSAGTASEKKIIAHVVPHAEKTIGSTDLFLFCKKNLPDYMIPDQFVFHTALPQTSTHKIDYRLLEQMHGTV